MKFSDQSRARRGVVNSMREAAHSRNFKRPRRQPLLEQLERRALLTKITEFATGSGGLPAAITTGADGSLWFALLNGDAVGRINPKTHAINTFSSGLPAIANPTMITSGPNGDLWFTESGLSGNAIGMIDPNNTAQPIQNFGSSAGISSQALPFGITSVGNDIWFTEPLNDKLGKLDTTTGHITEFPAPSAMAGLQARMTLGPDGNLWFGEFGAIGIFNPTTATLVKEVPLPGGRSERPFGITVGPDGNIWYGAGVLNATGNGYQSYAVGVISTRAPNTVKEIPLSASTQPFSITAGPDGKVWVAVSKSGSSAGTIDQIDPSTQAITQTLPIPTNMVAQPDPTAITAGPDGNLWFTDGGGAVGVVNLNVQPSFVVTTAPSGVMAGQGFGLTVTAEFGSGIVDTQFNGNVTVSLANIPSGGSSTLGGPNLTVSAVNGVATFSGLTLNKAAGGYTLEASSSGTNAPAAVNTSAFNVAAAAATKLVVTSQPPATVSTPFGFAVAAEDPFGNVETNFSGTVIVTLATNAGGAGTTLGGTTSLNISPASATPGFVTFSGLSLNNAGTGYKLGVSSTPALSTTTTNAFDVTVPISPPPPPPPPPPPSPPPPPTIVGESAVITQKRNKKNKPIGKATLSGYTITFSTDMDQTALSNRANYQVALKVIKKVKVGKKKLPMTVLQPIGFSVAKVTANSVTLTLAGKQKFPKGGQITLIAAAPAGLDSTSHVFLAQNGILAISPNGTRITFVS
jgi:streptogramin lyase